MSPRFMVTMDCCLYVHCRIEPGNSVCYESRGGASAPFGKLESLQVPKYLLMSVDAGSVG